MLLLLLQVMPVHATRLMPGSEKITSNIPQLMAAFDPAKPLTFQVQPLLQGITVNNPSEELVLW
jgi:hypothetical protein